MQLILFLLNLPFTLTGIIPVLLSVPYRVRVMHKPLSLIFSVKSFWWWYKKKTRAMTIGHMILLSPKELKHDLEHERIHVQQAEKYPFIFPFLYGYETWKKGYRMNRFEDEAYRLSHSVYNGERQ